jgi:hypothetical protein
MGTDLEVKSFGKLIATTRANRKANGVSELLKEAG